MTLIIAAKTKDSIMFASDTMRVDMDVEAKIIKDKC